MKHIVQKSVAAMSDINSLEYFTQKREGYNSTSVSVIFIYEYT